MIYNNYHKHTHVSNIFTPDVNDKAEDFIKQAVEYGHRNYFTTEHGSMGDIFEARTLCDKYGIRCIPGIEGYIVPDPLEKDKSNYHIIIIPQTNIARKKINYASSMASIKGYYYKPRFFLDDLLNLDKDDVFITSACCAGLLKDQTSLEQILLPLVQHFGNNVFLEVQNHDVDIQKDINIKALELSRQLGLKLIAANDSHYVKSDGYKERLELLKGKGITYDDEDTFILDYPDYNTMKARFLKQGILSEDQISEAIANTLIFDNCEEISLDKSIKMPNIYKDLTPTQRYEKLESEVWTRFDKIKKKESITDDSKYVDGIKYELETIKNTNDEIHTADYFLFNEKMINIATNKYDGILTRGGRGSAGSFYINKILGMTQLDRFQIHLPIFPDRFASTARLLENRALPDIDLNVVAQEPFVKASKELLGENGCYPMIAYGTMQLSEAFRNVCRSHDIPHSEYNEVGKNIEAYGEDKRWRPIIEEAQRYVGTIVSASVHPCAHLLLDKDILYEYGVVKIGDAFCVMMTSSEADEYKYLKDDFLIVKVWKLISETFAEIGKPIIDAHDLLNSIRDDQRVWDLFKNGITCTLNQVDSDNGMRQAKQYEISSFEDGAFIAAAIRPSFDSWRERFLNRVDYSTGSKDLDSVLNMTHHYILFQENLMQYFEWLGVTPAESIGLIKKISKKKIKQSDFDNLESRLREAWVDNTGSLDQFAETWDMIQSCISYGFCSAHAAATSLDMCYGAYLKVNYPLEYYTVCFNNYIGDATRTNKLRNELNYFGIKLSDIKFGFSRSKYSYDKKTNTIYKGLQSIKFLNEKVAEEMYDLRNNKYNTFVDLLFDLKEKTSLNTRQRDILIKIDFFSEFGDINKMLDVAAKFDELSKGKSTSQKKAESLGLEMSFLQAGATFKPRRVDDIDYQKYVIDHYPDKISLKDCEKKKRDGTPNGYSLKKFIKKFNPTEDELFKYATKIIDGKYSEYDLQGVLNAYYLTSEIPPCSLSDKMKYQLEFLGYIDYKNEDLDPRYIVITDLDTTYSPKFKAYCMKNGVTCEMRVKKRFIKTDPAIQSCFEEQPFENGDILFMDRCRKENKRRKTSEGWIKVPDEFNWWILKYSRCKNV